MLIINFIYEFATSVIHFCIFYGMFFRKDHKRRKILLCALFSVLTSAGKTVGDTLGREFVKKDNCHKLIETIYCKSK